MESLLQAVGQAFGWALRNSLQASVLILLVLLAQWAFRKRLSPGWRHALWLLVLARLLLPVTPPSRWSVFNVPQIARSGAGGSPVLEIGAAPALANEARPVAELEPPETATSVVEAARPAVTPKEPAAAPAKPTTPARTESLATDGSQPTDKSLWALGLGGVWLLGALGLLAQVVLSGRRLNAELARQHAVVNPTVGDVLAEAQARMDVRRVLPVVQSRAVGSPALMGFIRPWLLLPEGVTGRFTPEELRFVFLHELAHLKRRDILVNWLMTAVQILHWFNPLVWLAFSRMRADRELACDAHALGRAPESDRRPYGRTMIKLLEGFTRPAVMAGLVGILEDPNLMKRRITMIKHDNPKGRWPWLAPVLLCGLGLVALTDAERGANAATVSVRAAPQSLTVRKLPMPGEIWWAGAPQIAPDGSCVVSYQSGGMDLLVASLTGGKSQLFGHHLNHPVFSPDASQLAACTGDSHPWMSELVILDRVTGGARNIYRSESPEVWCKPVAWAPDGRDILVTLWDTQGLRRLLLIAVEDGASRLVTSDPKMFPGHAAFSPDGLWIVYESTPTQAASRDLSLVRKDGTGATAVVAHPSEDVLLGWAPRGDAVIFASERRGDWSIYALPVNNGTPVGEARLLKESIGEFKVPLGVTVQGAVYYVISSLATDIYLSGLTPDSGLAKGPLTKAARFEGRNQYPAWSPDSQFLAYVEIQDALPGDGGVVCVQNVEDGTVRQVTAEVADFAFPKWFPDGRTLLVSSLRDEGISSRLDVASGKADLVATNIPVNLDTWCTWLTPDGRHAYHQSGREQMDCYDLGTGRWQTVSIPENNFSTVLSPDGTQFAYSVTKTDERTVVRTIHVVRVGGGEPRQLCELTGPEAIEALKDAPDNGLGWTPDNRYVLFVKGHADHPKLRSLWRVPAGGGEPESVGVEMEELREPVISPDGRHLAFTSGGTQDEVWVVEGLIPDAP